MANNRLVAESTHRLIFTIKKNGVPWDLTGATVTVTFSRATDGPTPFDRTLTVSSAVDGTAYYDTATTDFDPDDEGTNWRLKVRVVQGAIDDKSERVGFVLLP